MFQSVAPLYCTLLVNANVLGNTILNSGAILDLVFTGLISSSERLHSFLYIKFRKCTFLRNSSLGVLTIEWMRSVLVLLSAHKHILIHLFCIL